MKLNPSVTFAQSTTFAIALEQTGKHKKIPATSDERLLPPYCLRVSRTNRTTIQQDFRNQLATIVKKYKREGFIQMSISKAEAKIINNLITFGYSTVHKTDSLALKAVDRLKLAGIVINEEEDLVHSIRIRALISPFHTANQNKELATVVGVKSQ